MIDRFYHMGNLHSIAITPQICNYTGLFCNSYTSKRTKDDENQHIMICTHPDPNVKFICFLSDKRYVFNTPNDTTLTITGKYGDIILKGHTMKVNCCCVLSNDWIVSGSDDKSLIIWDSWTGKIIATLVGHTSRVTCCYTLQDGRICSGQAISQDQTDVEGILRIWDSKNFNCQLLMTGHTDTITHITETPSHQIVSCSKDKTIILWKPIPII